MAVHKLMGPTDGANRWEVPGGRVEFYPIHDSMVRVVAFDRDDNWICEFMCRRDRFQGAKDIAFLEERVVRSAPLRLVQGRTPH